MVWLLSAGMESVVWSYCCQLQPALQYIERQAAFTPNQNRARFELAKWSSMQCVLHHSWNRLLFLIERKYKSTTVQRYTEGLGGGGLGGLEPLQPMSIEHLTFFFFTKIPLKQKFFLRAWALHPGVYRWILGLTVKLRVQYRKNFALTANFLESGF